MPTPRNKRSPAARGDYEASEIGALAKFGYFVTFCIKIGGLAIAGNEALFTDPPRDAVVFGVAAFMMAGASGIDSLLGNLLGKQEAK